MIGFKSYTDDDLRNRHAVEVLGHKSEEVDVVQLEQDEAIAAIYEELIGLLYTETGSPVEMVDIATVTETCKDLINKAVANKVNTAVKKAVDAMKEALKAEIIEELTADDAETVEEPSETAEEPSEGAQEADNGEGEETVEQTEETSEGGSEPSEEPTDAVE